ncbi:DNA helicase-2/ATP-dependent DNA helicase PcrA [Streptomyces sp. 846.5]|nr:UvrD-helicase domain-containing protein [Streptomyces sp. 846.5]TDT97296.1 DNA helicase-2/ATP-dependent DNA helicase PcrA [Streptomyces sp. 846.5]
MAYEARKDQQEVIDSTAPVVLVTGGAGTGKTATAVAAARAHLEASDRDLELLRQDAARSGQRTQLPAAARVLFLSFSRTAVAQIIDRAAGVIGPLRPRLEVATFHGFAWRIISSFGAHHGFPPPQYVLSEANRLVPGAPPGLTYNQLMPAAAGLLKLPKVNEHYSGRYSLVICDEFQDTDATEWEFVQQIAPGARRILLGDVNQSIFQGSFKPGVDPAARIAAAMAQPDAVRIDLEPASYRDPSGVLPAAAEAARTRDFSNPAFQEAASHGRLAVTRYMSGSGYEEVIDLARAARRKGHTVSVFTHTNAATTALSDALTAAGLAHEQVGFTEAHAEAMSAQLALLQYALGDDAAPVRRALAVYITACLRSKTLSPLARNMLSRTNPVLERALGELAEDLRSAGGGAASDIARLADVLTGAYGRIGTFRGQESWLQAASETRRALLLLDEGLGIDAVAARLRDVHDETLVGSTRPRPHPIQVMNLHQSKGREADTTILLLGDDEYYGPEGEPFPSGSRLLYVVMTRAREQAHLVVPAQTHRLWAPLIAALE